MESCFYFAEFLLFELLLTIEDRDKFLIVSLITGCSSYPILGVIMYSLAGPITLRTWVARAKYPRWYYLSRQKAFP